MNKAGRVAALSSLAIFGMAHVYLYFGFQPDDAFIYLVYVKNLLAGNGLTFNGQLVEGYSSIVYPLAVALFGKIGLDLLIAGKLLGVASYFFVAYLGTRILAMLSVRQSAKYAWLLLFFAIPPVAMWAPAAMETLLYTAFIAVAIFLYLKAKYEGGRRRYLWAGSAFAAIAYCRPEGGALVGGVIIAEMYWCFVLRKKHDWNVAWLFAIFAFFVSCLFVGRFVIYGKLLPATVGAKTGDLATQMGAGWSYLEGFSRSFPGLVVAYVVSLAGLLGFGRKFSSETIFAVVVLQVFMFGYIVFVWLVGGDWMLGWRFLVPVLPLGMLGIVITLSGLFKNWFPFVSVMIVLSVVGPGYVLYKKSVSQTASDAGDIQMGMYLHERNLPKESVIAVIDAGAIPYYSGIDSIDMVGLNDAYLSSLPGGFMQKFDNDYVLGKKPAVIQMHTQYVDGASEVVPSPVFVGTTRLFYSDEFQKWYDRDPSSPVPHLFNRRAVPRNSSFLDSFFRYDIAGSIDGGRLIVVLNKLGDGVWVAPSSNYHELGAVYLRYRVSSLAGSLKTESLIPLREAMRKGDRAVYDVPLPAEKAAGYKVSVCPVLFGVREFSSCSDGNDLELNIGGGIHPIISVGSYRFDDPRFELSGWSVPESDHVWSLGTESSLTFNLGEKTGLRNVSLRLQAFGKQDVMIRSNDVVVFKGALEGDGNVGFQVFPDKDGRVSIVIEHPGAVRPSDADPRVISVALKGIIIKE